MGGWEWENGDWVDGIDGRVLGGWDWRMRIVGWGLGGWEGRLGWEHGMG